MHFHTLWFLSVHGAGVELLVTDQTTPKLSRLGLSAPVRALNPSVPVLPCTGYQDESQERSAYEHVARLFQKTLSEDY